MVLEGLLITVLVLVGLRTVIFNAIPMELKTAISVGIGLFIALIGLVDAGFVRRTGTGPVPVELGNGGQLQGWPTLVFVFGLLLTAVLVARRTRGAILLGIVIIITTVVAIAVEALFDIGPSFVSPEQTNPGGWQLNVPSFPDQVFDLPDLSLIGGFSLFGGFARVGVVAAVLLVFTLMLADFFDTMGTVVASVRRRTCWMSRATSPGPTRCCWSTRCRRWPVVRRPRRLRRPTSSRPPESATARAPASQAS